MSQISRFIKTKQKANEKVVTSVNIEKAQLEFVEKHDLNLSMITREAIEALMTSKKVGSK